MFNLEDVTEQNTIKNETLNSGNINMCSPHACGPDDSCNPDYSSCGPDSAGYPY